MKIEVSKLKHHPKNQEIYTLSSIEDLTESIAIQKALKVQNYHNISICFWLLMFSSFMRLLSTDFFLFLIETNGDFLNLFLPSGLRLNFTDESFAFSTDSLFFLAAIAFLFRFTLGFALQLFYFLGITL